MTDTILNRIKNRPRLKKDDKVEINVIQLDEQLTKEDKQAYKNALIKLKNLKHKNE